METFKKLVPPVTKPPDKQDTVTVRSGTSDTAVPRGNVARPATAHHGRQMSEKEFFAMADANRGGGNVTFADLLSVSLFFIIVFGGGSLFAILSWISR
jgi:hypothetical protein